MPLLRLYVPVFKAWLPICRREKACEEISIFCLDLCTYFDWDMFSGMPRMSMPICLDRRWMGSRWLRLKSFGSKWNMVETHSTQPSSWFHSLIKIVQSEKNIRNSANLLDVICLTLLGLVHSRENHVAYLFPKRPREAGIQRYWLSIIELG